MDRNIVRQITRSIGRVFSACVSSVYRCGSDVVAFILSVAITVAPLTSYANPEGGSVAAGQVTIQQAPNTTTINQSSQKAIINWQSFNIGAQESTHFNQPAGGVALNRISPTAGASQIYGMLTATGQIILINPAGIYFGPTAYVNVGGLIASTANITDQNFLNNIYQFSKVSGYSGAIINEGQIIAAQHGLIALMGPGVINNGMIEANLGHIALASGDAFTINFSGDNLIHFAIDAKTAKAGIDKDGNVLNAGVTNTGSVIADGGKIIVSAKTAAGVLDQSINMQGVAQAKSFGQHNGEIILSGDADFGKVTVAARLDASGKKAGEKGGKVTITGRDIAVNSPTVIDVSGDAGGGDIFVGGNFQGSGPLPNANALVMASGTNLYADAITHGSGGNVILWSDNATRFYGNIYARGGALGGNGGFVETSGKQYLDVEGSHVNTLAPNGLTGTWLLDPTNIYIALNQANATTAGMSGTNTSADTASNGTFAGSGVIQDSLLTTGNLTTALGSSNVIVTTTNASGTGLGNITVVDPITWSAANSLTLTAANNLAINGAITMNNASARLILDATGSVTQTAAIAGTGGVTKQGAGTFTMSQANTYSGSTLLNQGAITLSGSGTATSTAFTINHGTTLTLDNTSTNNTNRLSNSSALTMNGGEFVFKGSNVAATNASETVGALTLPVGSSTVTLNSGTGGSTTLTFASISRTVGATALFRGTNLGSTAGAGNTNLMFTSSTGLGLTGGNSTQTNKPIVPYAIGDTSATGSGIGFVTYNINPANNTANTTGIRPLNSGTEYAATSTAGANMRIAANTTAPNANISYNSILLTGGSNFTLNNSGASGRTVTVTTGSIFSTSGSNSILNNSGKGLLAFAGVEAKIFALVGGDLTITSATSGTGGLTKNSGGVLTLPDNTVTGTFTIAGGTLRSANSATTIIDNSSLVTILPGATLDLATNNSSETIGALTMYSGQGAGASVTTGTGTLTLGGTVTLNANGAGDTGATISGNLALGASRIFSIADGLAANDLSISALISGSGFNLTKQGAGTLSLSNASNSYSGSTTISAGTLSIANAGALGSTSSTSVTSGAALDLAFNSATLGNTNTITLNGSGINSAGALTLSGNSITVNNPITLGSAVTIGGTGSGSMVFGSSISSANSLTYNLPNASLSFPAITLTGGANLSVITGGAISQTSALTISGTSSFNAGANAITLTNSSNDFTGAVSFTNSGNNNVSVTDANAIVLGTSSVGSGTFTVNATGANSITQTGAITQAASAGAASFTTGSGAITLTQNNDFTGAVSLTNTGANNVAVTDSNALILGASSVGSGTLGITSGGSITQTGAITQASGAGTVTIASTAAASDVDLSTQANNFSGSITFGGTLGNIRDVGLRNTNSGAVLPTNLTSLTNLRSLTLTFNNAAIALPALTLASGGNMAITAGGAITQSGAIVVPGTASFTAGANAITLTNSGNDFTGAVSLSNSGANAVSLRDANALSIGSSSVGSGTFTLTSVGLTQTGAITQAASAGAVTINAGSGVITLNNSSNDFTGSVSLNNSGANNVTLADANALSIGLSSVGSGTLTLTGVGITQSGAITQAASAGAVTVNAGAGVITLNDSSNDFTGSVSLNNSGANAVSLRDTNALTLAASSVGSSTLTLTSGGLLTLAGNLSSTNGAININSTGLTLNSSVAVNSGTGAITANAGSGTITLNSGSSITANNTGNVIVLAGSVFTNNAGGSVLNPGSGNYLVWSGDPSADNRGGLAYDFKQYNATYGVSTVLGSGNGFLYTLAPFITPSLTGTVSKVYDATTTATLAGGNFTSTGTVDGDTVSLTSPSGGTYDDQHAGTGKNVSVSGIAIAGASNGSATVYGYQLASTSASGNVGTITAKALTASLTNSGVTKVYDATTSAPAEFTPTYSISGFVSGDTAASLTSSGSAYNSAHVLAANTLTVSGLAISGITGSNGSLASDYSVNSSANVSATITAKALTASLTNSGVTKVYDATTDAPAGFTPTYSVSGFVSGDTSATIANTGSVYNSAHVADANQVTVSGLSLSGITGSNSSLVSDYSVNSSANVAATITPKALTASLTNSSVTKVYDATTDAPAGFSPTYNVIGLVSGDTIANLNYTSSAYNSAHVLAANTLTVNGISINSITGSNSSAASDYSVNSSANVAAAITPKSLTASLTNSGVTKVYDTTTSAPVGFTPTYSFTGLVSGDTSATLTNTGSAYNSPDVLTATHVTVSGIALNSISGSNGSLVSDYSYSPASLNVAATITPASLTASLTGTVSKVYNASLNAAIASNNYNLTGILGSDDVSLNNPTLGSYDNVNVGTGKNVAVSGLALSGSSATNYALASTSINGNVGVITPASLTVSSNASQTKVYGDNDPSSAATAYSVSSGTLYGSDALSGSLGRVSGELVGSYNFTQNTLAVNDGNSGNNYTLTFNGSSNPFVITQRALSGTIANQTKVYGANDPSVSGIGVVLGNVVNATVTDINGNSTPINDNGSVTGTLSGLTRDAGENVGSYNITASSYNLSGSAAPNYSTAGTLSGTPILTINKSSALTASISDQSKVYGTSDPLASTISVALNNVINNPLINTWNGNASINDTGNVAISLASYTRVAGETVLGGPYAFTSATYGPLTGVSAGNYNAPVGYTGSPVLNITPATLTAGLTSTASKVYNATTSATLSAGNYTLSGVLGGDTVNLNNPTAGSYDTKDVGTGKMVTVNGLAISGSSASNYQLASTNASAAIGTITPATATASGVTANNKVYDGNTTATLNTSSAVVNGIYAGDNPILVDAAGYIANFVSANVGNGIMVIVSNLGLTGASAHNYTLTQPTGLTANITSNNTPAPPPTPVPPQDVPTINNVVFPTDYQPPVVAQQSTTQSATQELGSLLYGYEVNKYSIGSLPITGSCLRVSPLVSICVTFN